MKISHINVRSLFAKMCDLSAIVHQREFDIVGISETWLDEGISSDVVALNGYSLFRQDRGSRGGGVGLYVRDCFRAELVTLDFALESLTECIWVKLVVRGFVIVVGVMYRPPNRKSRNSRMESFIRDIDNMLNYICPMADYVVCLGDVNVNMMNVSNPVSECLSSYGFTQVISEPTRVTYKSSTLIDPIFVNCASNLIGKCGVICTDHISDHAMPFCELVLKPFKRQSKIIEVRDFSGFDPASFLADLQANPWHRFLSELNVNKKVDMFNGFLIDTYGRHAPLRRKRVTKPKAEWLTETIRALMKTRDIALNKFKRSGSNHDQLTYRSLRNRVLSEIRKSKKSFLFEASHGGCKKSWDALRSLYVHRRPHRLLPDTLSDPDEINNFFAKFNGSVNDAICSERIEFYQKNQFPNSSIFEFRIVDMNALLVVLGGIKSRSFGCDGISLAMLGHARPFIDSMILHLINSCILCNSFPMQWKEAIGVPLPKVINPTAHSELRIISILPVVSKILERILYDQIYEYVVNCDLLPAYQNGFRKYFSTATALASVTDDVFSGLDKGSVVLLLLLDFSKAFDTINHNLMCAKASYFGFSCAAVTMIRSFLSLRTQRIRAGGRLSDSTQVCAGVPQGSILGPLLFIIYTSDLLSGLKYCKPVTYADDTELIYCCPVEDIHLASSRVNDDLKVLLSCATAHNLSINASKSRLLVYSKKRCRASISSMLDIQVDGVRINVVNSARNLGLMLDDELCFSQHVMELVRSAHYRLKALYSARRLLTFNMRRNLVESLVLSRFNYCDVVFGPCLNSFFRRRIQLVQNYCCRFVFGLRMFDHISHKINELGWLRMENRVKLHLACFVFKIQNTPSSTVLKDKLVPRSVAHDRVVRNRGELTVPLHRTARFQKCFSYIAVKVSNQFQSGLHLVNFYQYRSYVRGLLFCSQIL